MELALIDNKKFIELFENLVEKYHWRKNSNLYKLYLYSKEGKIQEIHKEIIFEDDNFTVYKEKNRYYLKFVLRPKRQMHVALKAGAGGGIVTLKLTVPTLIDLTSNGYKA